jgi:hypothetical protein
MNPFGVAYFNIAGQMKRTSLSMFARRHRLGLSLFGIMAACAVVIPACGSTSKGISLPDIIEDPQSMSLDTLSVPSSGPVSVGTTRQYGIVVLDQTGHPTADQTATWSIVGTSGIATISAGGLAACATVGTVTVHAVGPLNGSGVNLTADASLQCVAASGNAAAAIVLLPTGTVHLGVGASQVFTAYLVDAQGNRTAPASGWAIGMLTDVSGVAQAFNSFFSTTQLWLTATVQGLAVGTTPLRASYFNTTTGETTFSATTTITVP